MSTQIFSIRVNCLLLTSDICLIIFIWLIIEFDVIIRIMMFVNNLLPIDNNKKIIIWHKRSILHHLSTSPPIYLLQKIKRRRTRKRRKRIKEHLTPKRSPNRRLKESLDAIRFTKDKANIKLKIKIKRGEKRLEEGMLKLGDPFCFLLFW